MVKVIYFDIDGTLRDETSGISRKTKSALDRCRKKGIQLIICTGRNPACIQDDVLALNLDGVISGGGCYLNYHNETIFSKHFPAKTILSFLDHTKKQQLGISLESEQHIYMNNAMASFYKADIQKKLAGYSATEIEHFLRQNKLEYNDSLANYQADKDFIHKICVIGSEQSISNLRDWGGDCTQIVQDQHWNNKCYLECLPPDCSKGKAVEQLNRLLHLPTESSMAFGDGGNDIDLLRATGIGIAVSGGDSRLLRYADSICEPPAQNGIYKELIRRHLL